MHQISALILAFISHRRLRAGAAGTVLKHFIIQDLLCTHQGKRKVAGGDLWCKEVGHPKHFVYRKIGSVVEEKK